MRKPVFLAAVVCFIILLTVTLETRAEDEAARPEYRDGECWKFRELNKNFSGYVSGDQALPTNGEHEICFLEGKFVEVTDGTKRDLPSDGLWSPILFMYEKTRFLTFPLIPGKETTGEYEDRVRGTNRIQRQSYNTRVVGIEPITTAAGTFRTFKIVRENWLGGKLGSRWLYFYSPETKCLVKYNYEAFLGSIATREVELLEFRPAK